MTEKKEIKISKRILSTIFICIVLSYVLVFLYQFKGNWSWIDNNAPVTNVDMKEYNEYEKNQLEGTSKITPNISWRYTSPFENRYRQEIQVGSNNGMPLHLSFKEELYVYFNSSLTCLDYVLYLTIAFLTLAYLFKKFRIKLT